MPWEYLEEGVTADITLRATGADPSAVFTAAAEAATNVMVEDLDAVRPRETRAVEVEADTLDMLLFRFLGEIIFYKDAEGLLTRATSVRVEETPTGHRVTALLRGEPIDPARHRLAADAKAVTLYGLRVAREENGWTAQVTIDV